MEDEQTTMDEQRTASEAKETYLWMAKLAQQASRYDEMSSYMRMAAETGQPCTRDEDNMLSVAYKHAVDARREARRALLAVEQQCAADGWEAAAAWEYRAHVENELLDVCRQMVAVIDSRLSAYAAAELPDITTEVFYWKLRADYNRYAAEATQDPAAWAAVVDESRAAYERADDLSQRSLRPIDPTRLGLMLNYSVFLYQVCQQRRLGCELASRVFDEAVAEIDSLDDTTSNDSTVILRLIRDNLAVWNTETEELCETCREQPCPVPAGMCPTRHSPERAASEASASQQSADAIPVETVVQNNQAAV